MLQVEGGAMEDLTGERALPESQDLESTIHMYVAVFSKE